MHANPASVNASGIALAQRFAAVAAAAFAARARPAATGVLTATLAVLLAAAGCAVPRAPSVPPSQGHIMVPAPENATPAADIPPPVRLSTFVPPPRPALKPQTYSVVVNEVPVKELLLALSRDTRQNIDIHSGITGLVSLNAINETLPAILERIAKQVNLRYRVEGNTIIVSVDNPHVKTYRVNYVNASRTVTSTINVTGEVGGAGTAGSSSGSKTEVISKSNNDFWEQLKDNIQALLISTRRVYATEQQKAEFAQERDEARKMTEAVSRAGAGASELAKQQAATAPKPPATLQSTDVGKDVIVNPISGTVTVLATEQQHQLIQQHLDSITSAVQRQVLIEATIVEVQLSEAYQGGINWSRVAIGGGLTLAQTVLGGFGAAAVAAGATAGNVFSAAYQNQNPNTPFGNNINLTVKLLQEFGNTRVLSSPKLMTLNNQTALLKVVENIVYFEVVTTAATVSAGVVTAGTTNTTAKTVAVGMVMGVTPQIADDGRVSLNIRPTISRVSRFVTDPNPTLVAVQNLVPEIQVREMESMLQVGSGQTVILGGLMQDDVKFKREQLPGADKMGAAGDLVRFRNESATKTELVIFLRPTVVTNPTLDSEELKFFRRYLPQAEPARSPQAPWSVEAAPDTGNTR